MARIAATPAPPYYAVIFTSRRTEDRAGYAETAARMLALAAEQRGYLGVEQAEDGELGMTVSYWDSLEAITAWRENVEHRMAQAQGKERWYEGFAVRVCRVERAYDFEREA